MKNLTHHQIESRQKTLLTAMLLSMWAPLTTGWAVLLSHSTTQLADFIRRSVELLALFISWLVFVQLAKEPDRSYKERIKLEQIASLSVAVALISSGIVMLVLGISRINSFSPGGNVYPGLAIASLGLIVNSWFWRRYATFHREEPNTLIQAQQQLYRAKAIVDLCVIIALAAVAINPTHSAAHYLDILGSILVALYLLGSGIRNLRDLASHSLNDALNE